MTHVRLREELGLEPGGELRRLEQAVLDQDLSLDELLRCSWVQFFGCVHEPLASSMGIHFVNGLLAGDTAIDRARPEALTYEVRPNGELALVGVEYVVFQEAWDAEHDQPPSLFGQTFVLVPSANRYGIPRSTRCTPGPGRPTPPGRTRTGTPRSSARAPTATSTDDPSRLRAPAVTVRRAEHRRRDGRRSCGIDETLRSRRSAGRRLLMGAADDRRTLGDRLGPGCDQVDATRATRSHDLEAMGAGSSLACVTIPGFEHVLIEESRLRSIRADDTSARIEVDLVLLPEHPDHTTPGPGEPHRQVGGTISFTAADAVVPDLSGRPPALGADGTLDLGRIDRWVLDDGHHHLSGGWGDLDVWGGDVRLAVDLPANYRIELLPGLPGTGPVPLVFTGPDESGVPEGRVIEVDTTYGPVTVIEADDDEATVEVMDTYTDRPQRMRISLADGHLVEG